MLLLCEIVNVEMLNFCTGIEIVITYVVSFTTKLKEDLLDLRNKKQVCLNNIIGV